MMDWTRDEAYSCEETACLGDFAAVICPPDFTDNGWGVQVFDEADDEAIECGETYNEIYNLPNADAAKAVAETILEKLAETRI